MAADSLIIDDRTSGSRLSSIGAEWQLITDTVMGGVSNGSVTLERFQDQDCLCLRGDVSTENNGGFIQMALSVGSAINNQSDLAGIELDVAGNNQEYNVHFRTSNLSRPWQSYRASFMAKPTWQTIRIAFADITAHQTDVPFQLDKLNRIGLLAIGREFHAELCLAGLRFYRAE